LKIYKLTKTIEAANDHADTKKHYAGYVI